MAWISHKPHSTWPSRASSLPRHHLPCPLSIGMQVTVSTLQMKKLCYDKKVTVLVSGKSWVVVKPQVEGEMIRAHRGK